MSWTLLCGLVLALGIALLAAYLRRAELTRMQQRVRDRDRAVRSGAEAQLRHPVVDLSRCLGCGTCVAACPENGVLELVHGQAMIVNGARCVGHGTCERECPVGAITVTLTRLSERRDIPVLDESLEAIGSPGLFLAGEVTAHALIKPAIEQGTAVANEVARRCADRNGSELLDLCVVGAGPAGLACSLEAKRLGLSFVTLDQEMGPGGTVAKYPRRKLVLTQPVDLPLHGRLERTSYTKEELIELWQSIAREQQLPLRGGEVLQRVERSPDGSYVVHTDRGAYAARHVCLALGRRGTPKKLGVPGEDLPKVAYSLLDARSYSGRRILVVGGGDSAVETALGLAEQDGNEVTLSYRREGFFRIRARNEQRLEQCLASGRLRVVFQSEVIAIGPEAVEIEAQHGAERQRFVLPNDEVFVMAGGIAPFELLERSGVSFDPTLHAPSEPLVEQGTGLLRALGAAFGVALLALAWALWHSDYYLLPTEARPADAKHAYLRPGRGLGLAFGIAATVMVVVNLLYLVRRSPRFRLQLGSLQAWMTSHVATGILALSCALLHGAMAPRDTVGGHALVALAVLLVTGAIGRYFYAYVPRAANGRELQIEEVKLRLAQMAEQWDKSQRTFVDRVQREVARLIESQQWRSSFFGRIRGLIGRATRAQALARAPGGGRRARRRAARAHRRDAAPRQARAFDRTAAAHYEDLRAVLNSWRYAHRWIAVLMVILLAAHITYAFVYGSMFGGAQ
jgi:thioredoxin reductase/Pyruvate/2-oxoacid:ferredoxin oxidoreductase delta subunit